MRYRGITTLISAGVLLTAPAAADAATTLYASPTGAPAAGACPSGAPCSIERALTVAVSGDTVIALAGSYTPPGTLTVSEGKTLQGAPGPRPTITSPAGTITMAQGPTGGLPTAAAASMVRHLRLVSPTTSVLAMGRGANAEDLVVESAGANTGAVYMLASGTLRSSVVVTRGAGGTAAVMTQATPSVILSTSVAGTLRNVTAIATSPAGRGILAYAPTGTTITGCSEPFSLMNLRNVITRGGFADIHLLGTATTGTGGIPCRGEAKVNADHTNFRTIVTDAASVEPTGATTFGLNNQTSAALTADDKIFADAAYHQLPTSPTVNAGVVDTLPPFDIDGDPIPSLGAPDIGGDELGSFPVTPPTPPADPGGGATAPTTTGAGTGTGATTQPPRFRLLSGLVIAKRVTRAALLRSGLLTTFTLNQPRSGYALALTAKLRRRGKLRTTTLATAKAVNQADGGVRVRLRVSKGGRTALRRAPKTLKATLTVKVTGAEGLAQTSSQTVTITR